MNIDPIADMLTRIRNALQARHSTVDMPASRMKVAISRILKQEDYIEDFMEVEQDNMSYKLLRIYLRYDDSGKPMIQGLKRVSRGGRRVYSGSKRIPRTLDGIGMTLLSTSRGIMTDRQARKENVGGEVLAKIW